MRKIFVCAAAAAMLGTLAGPALAGTADGQGAQKAQLVSRAHSNDCKSGTATDSNSAQPNGFVILNSTGAPGSNGTLQGEVSLKNGAPGGVYAVMLQSNTTGNNCQQPVGMITANGQGNGNLHITAMHTGQTFWVVVKPANGNEYASAPVPLD